MSVKHTPGPWVVENDCEVMAGDALITAIPSAEENAEDLANLRLIAAAPELLKELRYALKEQLHHDVDCCCTGCSTIAKAEGRT